MGRTLKKLVVLALWLCGGLYAFASPAMAAGSAATIRHISVLGAGKNVELEITASQPLNPTAQAVKNPERLVIDFPGALPASDLQNVSVNRGDVRTVRVGLFTKDPPVTRVVIDLDAAQNYQLFPSGKNVIVKLSGLEQAKPAALPQVPSANLGSAKLAQVQAGSPLPAIATISYQPARKRVTPQAQAPVPKPRPNMEVEYADGRLRIWANKANLSQVLYEVHRRTGADIPIPAGAEQEQVVTDIPPSPPRDAVSMLLNGSHFNFIIVGADNDPGKLKSVLLTPKGAGGASQPIIYTGNVPVESSPEQPEPAQAEAPVTEQPPIEQPVTDQPPNQQPANEPAPEQTQPDMTPHSMPPEQPAEGPPQ
jgi:AMIN domain